MRHAHTQQRRPHQPQDIFGSRVRPGRAQGLPAQTHAWREPQFAQGQPLHRQLQHPTQQHTAGQRINGLNTQAIEPRCALPGRHDHAQVQEHRCGCGHSKPFPGVEHASGQGHQRHEGNVGKHPARHDHGNLEAARILLQAAGHAPHHERCRCHANQAEHQQGPGQYRGGVIDHLLRCRLAMLGFGRGQHRHKGLAERTFAKKAPEQIGNTKRDVESIRHGIGAKSGGNQQFTRQPGDA